MRLNFIFCKPVAFMTTLFVLAFALDGSGSLVTQTRDQGGPAGSLPGQANAHQDRRAAQPEQAAAVEWSCNALSFLKVSRVTVSS